MFVPYRKLIDTLTRTNKKYNQVRLTATLNPPLLYSKHTDSVAIQLLENEYLYLMQDGDIIVSPPVCPDQRTWIANDIRHLVGGEKDKTILQYKKGAGLISLAEVPDDLFKVCEINVKLISLFKDALNKTAQVKLPYAFLTGLTEHPRLNCFTVDKTKSNYKAYLERMLAQPNIAESILVVGMLNNYPLPLNFIAGGKYDLIDMTWLLFYHPKYGVSFIGSITDILNIFNESSIDVKLSDDLEVRVVACKDKQTFKGELCVNVTTLELPEIIIDMVKV